MREIMTKNEMLKNEMLANIDDLWIKADRMVISLIQSEARQILIADEGLDEFIMAMGGCHFSYKEGSKYDMLRDGLTDEMIDDLPEEDNWFGRAEGGIIHDTNFQIGFFEMVESLNERFSCMGYPMRFTAYGTVVNSW